ncbi:MFS transporter [Streptomyces sp. NPDC040724]|uniref:MFS transporter n=1 Tax=unclassified Streptomyces TaxID=2593676 RepID=UPI0033CFCAD4
MAKPTIAATSPRRFGAGFLQLWSATSMSGLGDGVRIIALSVYAATVSSDPVAVSLVAVAGQLPWVLVGPLTGTLIDHLDRWRMLWICDVARAVVLACFVAVILADRVGIAALAITAFLLSSIETMADNLSQAVVPDVAGSSSLDSANSRLLTGRLITMEFLGAPVGTALFAVAHVLPFGLATVCFALSALLIYGVRGVGTRTPGQGRPLDLRMLTAQTGEGIAWLWRHRLLRTVCLMTGMLNFAVLAVMGVAVLYALHVLHVSETEYGLLLLVIAGGGLLGLMLAPRLIAVMGRGAVLQLSFALCPLAFALGGAAVQALTAAFAFAFVGISVALVNVVTTTLRQEIIPPDRFGSINGAYRLVINGLAPLGGFSGGLIADHFTLRAPFFLAAGLLAVVTLVSLPLLSNRSIGQLSEQCDVSPHAGAGTTTTSTGTADQ